MEKRNICDECLNCEGRNDYSLTDCFELCYHPVDALREIERKRNEQEKKKNALVIDNKNQKEFAHEITRKFSFEELALFMYENSCEYCSKHHNCMGNTTPQDCAENIRQKFEESYFETRRKNK